jgi:hypothetical protein
MIGPFAVAGGTMWSAGPDGVGASSPNPTAQPFVGSGALVRAATAAEYRDEPG